MISYVFMYLIVKLDAIVIAFKTLTWIFAAYGLILPQIGGAIRAICTEELSAYTDTLRKYTKVLPILVFSIFFALSFLTPNSKEAAAIYIIPKIANSEEIQNITDNSLKSLHELSRQWVEQLAPKPEQDKSSK